MGNVLSQKIGKTEKDLDTPRAFKFFNAECRTCTPISPLQCITGCRVYRLKNELRHLWGAMDNPKYMNELINVLKNETRLSILQIIANNRCSLTELQKELKRAGQRHSQETLTEYLYPLVAVGLVTIEQEEYRATTFGIRLTESLGVFSEFAKMLPARSECYEETILCSLQEGPKTFKEISDVIDPKIVSRTLKRLRSTRLIKTPKERDYVFFFKTKRDAAMESLTVNDQKVYDAVACDGVSAGKLAKDTDFSLRIVYKHLRRLKGKKLVFLRRTRKTYGLTCRGQKLALTLQRLQKTVEDTWNSSQQVKQDNKTILEAGGLSNLGFNC
jgi:predicted transcriptional regulator